MLDRISERDNRRHSSSSTSLSSSSVVTVKAASSSRPLGLSRFTQRLTHPEQGRKGGDDGYTPEKEDSPQLPVGQANARHPPAPSSGVKNLNRWSVSTASSASRQRSDSNSTFSNGHSAVGSPPTPSSSQHRQSDSPRKRRGSNDQRSDPISPRHNMEQATYSSYTSATMASAAGHGRHAVSSSSAELPHSRNESGATNRSSATRDSKRSSDSPDTDSPEHGRRKGRRDKDKKSLLARALQRANDAVVFDNQQDYVNAIGAYEEACSLLSKVMSRSSNEDDQRKLSAIRDTYVTRIQELQQINEPYSNTDDEDSPDPDHPRIRPSIDEFEPATEIATAVVARSVEVPPQEGPSGTAVSQPTAFARTQYGSTLRPNSAMPPPLSPRHPPPPPPPAPTAVDDSRRERQTQQHLREDDEREDQQLRRPQRSHDSWTEPFLERSAVEGNDGWLDTVDENDDDSPRSERHAAHSLELFRRKFLGDDVGETEADFDAALDSAIEAAYMEGFEPYNEAELRSKLRESFKPGRNAFAGLREVDAQPERPPSASPDSPPVRLPPAHESFEARSGLSQPSRALEYEESASDEGERLLTGDFNDELTTAPPQPGADFVFPRESGSSGFSNRTHPSSVASSNFTSATAGTSLTTVDENAQSMPTAAGQTQSPPTMPPPVPPPTGALPPPPPISKDRSIPTIVQHTIEAPPPSLPLPLQSPSVQDRRGSGTAKAKKLKIETAMPRAPSPLAKAAQESNAGKDAASAAVKHGEVEPLRIKAPAPSPYFASTFSSNPSSGVTPSTSGLTPALSVESASWRPSPQSGSPGNAFDKALPERPPRLRKNLSSLSLKQSRSQADDGSPGTPMSFAFTTTLAPPGGANVPMNTPASGAFPQRPQLPPSNPSAMRIFDSDFHSADPAAAHDPPRPLEPCPESTLLRPYWLLRCIHQTIAHPRGGYISGKLFIPRETWKAKNTKLKGVEDKVATCDLLTAALRKLATVDTFDAEAVLEEMQSFEGVLDLAQSNLSRKLGNEVGVQNVSSLFKDAPSSGSPAAAAGSGDNDRGGSGGNAGDTTSGGAGGGGGSSRSSSKNFVSSWRKLRNKSSGTGLNNNNNNNNSSATASSNGYFAAQRDGTRDGTGTAMASVPMTSATSIPRVFTLRRNDGVPDVQPDGPNAGYMTALMKLCDASQVLDQIARQVEDPGLKASSPQYVGLELCARHAAEFYAFYICRFVLQDLQLLIEKFVKRASEWVLGTDRDKH